MKELPPPPPLKKKHRSQSPNIRSLDLDLVLRSRRMINKVDLSPQAGMTNADINHGQGANHAQGPKDPHRV